MVERDGREKGSFWSIEETSSQIFKENEFGKGGICFVCRTFLKVSRSLPMKGSCPVISSYMIIPRLQTRLEESECEPSRISGER